MQSFLIGFLNYFNLFSAFSKICAIIKSSAIKLFGKKMKNGLIIRSFFGY